MLDGTQKTKTVTTIKLSGTDIFGSLIASNEKFAKLAEYATSVRVFVKIGGGGDFSNTDYDINKTDNLIIELVHETETKIK